MAKLTRFRRSQNAHVRMYRFWEKRSTREARAKESYHKDVAYEQQALGRVLTTAEKKKIFLANSRFSLYFPK